MLVNRPLPSAHALTAADANLASPIFIPLAGQAGTVDTGDLNGDTLPDIFAIDSTSPYSLILNNGAGGFLPPTPISGATGFITELKDVNNDGKPDIIYVQGGASFLPHNIYVRLGNGMGGFAAPVNSEFGVGLSFLKDYAFADFNNDNFLDITISTSGPGQTVPGGGFYVLLSNGAGGFVQSASMTINSRGADITAGDFNQDNKADIAVRNLGAGCPDPICQAGFKLFIGDGAGNFTLFNGIPYFFTEFVTGDANHDGKPDMIGVTNDSIRTLLSTGAGDFVSGQSIVITSGLTNATLADFNNDGNLDVALLKGAVYIVYGNGSGGFSNFITVPVGQTPYDFAVADFNGNGRPDLAVTNNNSSILSVILDPGITPQTGTRFDFDGDFKADIAVYREGNTPQAPSYWHILRSSDGGYQGLQLGANGDKPVPADYNGDGKTEVAVWRPSTGTWYTSPDAAINYGAFQWGQQGDIPLPGDFDGDGKADYCVYRPSNGNWYVLKSSNGGFQQQQFGTASDKPVLGDFDGDGKTDFAFYRPGATALANSFWNVIQSSNGAFSSAQFGRGEDKAVAADYNGDGLTDFAVYRPSTSVWYTSTNPAINYGATQWGAEGDVPAPADYDMDGKADLAIFRPGSSVWYIRRSVDGAVIGQQWGVPSDRPVPSSFIP
jgi:hypothetical protein